MPAGFSREVYDYVIPILYQPGALFDQQIRPQLNFEVMFPGTANTSRP